VHPSRAPNAISGRRSKPGASGSRSEAGCAEPRLQLLESLLLRADEVIE
jgi:hypothetical protein